MGNRAVYQASVWLVICALTEAIPIGGMLFGSCFPTPSPSCRDVLGYTTLVLVAIAFFVATLGDVIMEEHYRRMGPLSLAIGLGLLLAMAVVFGAGIMLDFEKNTPGERKFIPNERLYWFLEIVFVAAIFCGSAFAKVSMLNARDSE